MTKREVRVQILADLEIPKEGVLWDLGAGVGSIGLENLAIRSQAKSMALSSIWAIACSKAVLPLGLLLILLLGIFLALLSVGFIGRLGLAGILSALPRDRHSFFQLISAKNVNLVFSPGFSVDNISIADFTNVFG